MGQHSAGRRGAWIESRRGAHRLNDVLPHIVDDHAVVVAADGASAAAAAGRSRKRTIGTLAFSMSSHEPHSTSVERRALAATLRRSAAADGGGRAPAEPSGG